MCPGPLGRALGGPRRPPAAPRASRGRGSLLCEALASRCLGVPRVDPLGRNRPLLPLPSAARSWGRGAPSPFGKQERGGGCRSVSLFRENLCGPGVLPELLLLLGSLPKWGETGNSPRCWERYGRRGGDGGDGLPQGPRARCERLGGRGARTSRSPTPLRRPGVGDRGRPPGHRAPAGAGRGRGPGPRLALPAGEKARPPRAPVHRAPSGGTRHSGRAAKRTSLAVGAPLSAPRGSCGRIALRPPSLCVHVSEASVAGGCRRWLVPQRLGARSPARRRQRAAPPRAQPGASTPASDARATGLLKGHASGSFGRERTHRGLRPAGRAGDSCSLLASNTRGRPGAKTRAHARAH